MDVSTLPPTLYVPARLIFHNVRAVEGSATLCLVPEVAQESDDEQDEDEDEDALDDDEAEAKREWAVRKVMGFLCLVFLKEHC